MAAFKYRLTAPEKLITVEDYRRAAARKLPRMVWAYVDGGADDLVTLTDNRDAFSRWSLRQRVLAGHASRDLSTNLAGTALDLPVLLAPTGLSGLTHWRSDIAASRAAERAGTRYVLSTASAWSIEEVADATEQAHFFQLYPFQGEVAATMMRRAWAAGYNVMFATVDVPAVGNRERERRHGMGMPPVLTPRRMLNVARHPKWLYNVFRHRRTSMRNLVAGGGVRAAVRSVEIQSRTMMQSTLCWDDLAWMRDQWPGRLYMKGVLDPDDADRAVALGLDGVVVSNHGGRQLDCAQASLDALPAVADAIGGRAEVLLDGGVRRGTDIVKALALGADAVLVGRPYLYGLAVGGETGVSNVLEILRAELERTLALMGVGSVAELDRSWLVPRDPALDRLGVIPRT
jgi:isopentenyl diphosphate isomerase/L-lactate dehydrogenase-like FMN-dependent dehydrogenase